MHLSNTTAVLLDWGRATWSPERYMEQQPPAAGDLARVLPSALHERVGAKGVLWLEWKQDAY